MNIQCDNVIVERRPDIVILNKMEKAATIIDVALPGDRRIKRLGNLKKIDVRPVILGTLGSVTKNCEKHVDKIGIEIDLHAVQRTRLLGSARILRKVLECF